MRCPILIVYLHKLDFRELLEVVDQQIGDGICGSGAVACAFEVDVRDAVYDFEFAVTGEAIVERDPTVGISLGRAGTFEVFVQHCANEIVRARPADAGKLKGRQVVLVTILVDKVHVHQLPLRRGGWSARAGGSRRPRGSAGVGGRTRG